MIICKRLSMGVKQFYPERPVNWTASIHCINTVSPSLFSNQSKQYFSGQAPQTKIAQCDEGVYIQLPNLANQY